MNRKAHIILFPSVVLLVLGCSLDRPKHSENVVKDFNLGWWSDVRYTALFLNNDHTEYGGREIIPETVVEIGFNQDFIIAKQHPNKYKEIEDRVLDNETETGYQFENVADTAYLPKEFVKNENGTWYFEKEGINHLDHLFPFEGITYYYIITISDYRLRFWTREGNVFRFDNVDDFNAKRLELEVPTDLQMAEVQLTKD